MSIVLRQQVVFQDIKEKCPRCHYINLNVTVSGGWIEWKVS
jgi:phage FluMu protein Com